MNVASPYEALGVEENASLEQCTAAYKKLVKKYHPDLNPNDVIAREAMKEINRAYDSIKNNDFSHWHNQSDSTDTAQGEEPKEEPKKESTKENSSPYKKAYDETRFDIISINFTQKRNRTFLILSLGLFAACAYLLFEYVFKYCNYGNLMYFFAEAFKSNTLFVPDFNRVTDYLPNINTELYVNILAKLLLACAVSITAMLLITAIYNISHIITLNKLSKTRITTADIPKSDEDSYSFFGKVAKTSKLLRKARIINIIYAAFTYLTIILFFVTVAMYTVFQTALFIPFSFKTYKILMIGIAILMFVIFAIFISEKYDRIKESDCLNNGDCIENLDTLLKGVGIATIPMLIILSIVLLIIYIVLALLGGGRSDD